MSRLGMRSTYPAFNQAASGSYDTRRNQRGYYGLRRQIVGDPYVGEEGEPIQYRPIGQLPAQPAAPTLASVTGGPRPAPQTQLLSGSPIQPSQSQSVTPVAQPMDASQFIRPATSPAAQVMRGGDAVGNQAAPAPSVFGRPNTLIPMATASRHALGPLTVESVIGPDPFSPTQIPPAPTPAPTPVPQPQAVAVAPAPRQQPASWDQQATNAQRAVVLGQDPFNTGVMQGTEDVSNALATGSPGSLGVPQFRQFWNAQQGIGTAQQQQSAQRATEFGRRPEGQDYALRAGAKEASIGDVRTGPRFAFENPEGGYSPYKTDEQIRNEQMAAHSQRLGQQLGRPVLNTPEAQRAAAGELMERVYVNHPELADDRAVAKAMPDTKVRELIHDRRDARTERLTAANQASAEAALARRLGTTIEGVRNMRSAQEDMQNLRRQITGGTGPVPSQSGALPPSVSVSGPGGFNPSALQAGMLFGPAAADIVLQQQRTQADMLLGQADVTTANAMNDPRNLYLAQAGADPILTNPESTADQREQRYREIAREVGYDRAAPQLGTRTLSEPEKLELQAMYPSYEATRSHFLDMGADEESASSMARQAFPESFWNSWGRKQSPNPYYRGPAAAAPTPKQSATRRYPGLLPGAR